MTEGAGVVVDESRLEPDVAAALAQMRLVAAPPMHEMDLAALRVAMDAAALPGTPEVGDVRDLTLDVGGRRISARLYRDTSDPAPVLVFWHGGGWVFGGLDGIDPVCRLLARSGFAVLSATYRLAPEHPFPAAHDDAVAALRWAVAHPDELGGDGRVAVGGESAGANLAASAAAAAPDADVALQLLFYPPVDDELDDGSMTEFAEGFVLTREAMEFFWTAYVGERDRRDPRVALLATDLASAPPTVLVSAGYDVLRDGNRRYADALTAAGGVVDHLHLEGQLHGFAVTAPVVASARRAVEAAADRASSLLRRTVAERS